LGITENCQLFWQEPPKEETRHPKSSSAFAELADNIVERHVKCKLFFVILQIKIRKMVKLQNCQNYYIDRIQTTEYNAVVDKKLYCENATGGNE